MKKVIKESEKEILGFDIALYTIYMIIGAGLLFYPELEVINPVVFSTFIFFILGFFAIICYFVNRRKNNYEFLYLGLINIVVGAFVFIVGNSAKSNYLLCSSILIYTLLVVVNKSVYAYKLSKNDDLNMFPKIGIAIIIALLGVLITSNLYNEVTMKTLVLGYYFLLFGIVNIFEPIIGLFLRKENVKDKVLKIMYKTEVEEAIVKEEKKEVKKIKEVKIDKIKINKKKKKNTK